MKVYQVVLTDVTGRTIYSEFEEMDEKKVEWYLQSFRSLWSPSTPTTRFSIILAGGREMFFNPATIVSISLLDHRG